jgi:replicative DNA helicase
MNRNEEILLGTLIAYPDTYDAAQGLRSTDFTGTNRNLFERIQYLQGEESLSHRALVETLRDDSLLMLIGNNNLRGEAYINYLVDQADRASINVFVNRVEEIAIRKSLEEFAGLLTVSARDTSQPIEDVVSRAEKRVFDIRRRNLEDRGLNLGEILSVFMPRMEGMRAGTITPAWVPPVGAVKDLIDYVDRTDMVILAGRPGEGKSSALRFDALETAKRGQHVTTFNLENDELEYAKFALAAEAKVDSGKLKNPRLLSNAESQRILEANERIVNIPWTVVTLSSPNISKIVNLARKSVAENHSGLIQVDYLQLIRNAVGGNRVEDLSETTGLLRGAALKLKVPIIAACQLSRSIEYRGEASPPQLSDLRESGSIEQDATQVWFIRSMWHNPPNPAELVSTRFPENFDREGSPLPAIKAIPVQYYVQKNRNGPIGRTTPIKWRKDIGVFQSLRPGDIQ